jgi:hypothetical protein
MVAAFTSASRRSTYHADRAPQPGTPRSSLPFQAEADIGLLLPCNVIVYAESADRTRVAVLDPVAQLGISGREDLEPLTTEARTRLERALAALPTA